MIDVRPLLKALVGKKVTVDQSRLDPPSVTGILQHLDGDSYAVDDENGLTAGIALDWYEVATVSGTLIVLHAAENEPEWEGGGESDQVGNYETSEI
jgi:hypothetical protein